METTSEPVLYHEVNYSNSAIGRCVVIGCESETSHLSYISANDLCEAHLPLPIRCPELLNILRLNIDLAVKIQVKKNNEERYGNEASIGCADITGSGSICYFSDTHDLFRCNHGDNDACELCHIPNCPYNKTLGKDHYLITSRPTMLKECEQANAHLAFRVSTNQHVVADETDAKNSSVELFYHAFDKREVVVAKGAGLCGVWEEQDKIHLLCVADMNGKVLNLLQTMRPRMRELYALIPSDVRDKFINDYAVIISHPHGQVKVVSIGSKIQCQTRHWMNGLWYKETYYDASTCVGCSGAPVVGPGWEDGGPGYRVHVGYILQDGDVKKIGVSKSFWVVDSDARGGAPLPK